ncbi:GNAT family N-acetyltransferase [Roseovarius sp. D22-M7]|uniref:GNAT family N-acetyltransferase n=1 Tax=Roseovarius sp. D22-M7 TaxID=3127116 RepID=UPI00300F8F42
MTDDARYVARQANGPEDLRRAEMLRAARFGRADGADRDAFDARCAHLLVEERATGRLVCCCRLLFLSGGGEIAQSYSAQFYDLGPLARFEGRMAEIGRFCIAPDRPDPDILRVAWAALTRLVDARGIAMLFGCSSFAGVRAEAYLDSFAVLRARHLAPRDWGPRIKAPSVYRFAERLQRYRPDPREAMRLMPPLLRSYLAMGGRVSDHAVIDRDLGTLHVFTGLEVGAIPDRRKRALRALPG